MSDKSYFIAVLIVVRTERIAVSDGSCSELEDERRLILFHAALCEEEVECQ